MGDSDKNAPASPLAVAASAGDVTATSDSETPGLPASASFSGRSRSSSVCEPPDSDDEELAGATAAERGFPHPLLHITRLLHRTDGTPQDSGSGSGSSSGAGLAARLGSLSSLSLPFVSSGRTGTSQSGPTSPRNSACLLAAGAAVEGAASSTAASTATTTPTESPRVAPAEAAPDAAAAAVGENKKEKEEGENEEDDEDEDEDDDGLPAAVTVPPAGAAAAAGTSTVPELPPGSLSPTLEPVVARLEPLRKKCAARQVKPSYARSRAIQNVLTQPFTEDELRKPCATEVCERVQWALSWSPAGEYLASGGHDGSVRVWRRAGVDEGCVLQPNPVAVLRGHRDDIIACAWSRDNLLATGSMDRTVVVWDPAHSSERVLTLEHPDVVNCLCWNNNAAASAASNSTPAPTLLTSCMDHVLRHWQVDATARTATVLRAVNLCEFVTAMALTPAADQAVLGTFDGRCLFVDLADLSVARQFTIVGFRGKRSKEGKRNVTGLAVRRDAPELLVTSNDCRLRLYNLADLKLVRKYKGFACNKFLQISASFSRDGSHIICPSEDRATCFWPTAPTTGSGSHEGQSLDAEVFKCSTRSVSAAVFVPRRDCEAAEFHDSRFFVAADIRGALTVYENPDMSLLPP